MMQAETLACVLEKLSTDHPGNSCMARRRISALLPTPALQLRHSEEGTRLPCGDGKRNGQKFPNCFASSSLSVFHSSASSQQNVINDLSTPELPKAFPPPPPGKPAGRIWQRPALPSLTATKDYLRGQGLKRRHSKTWRVTKTFTKFWEWNYVTVLSIWH